MKDREFSIRAYRAAPPLIKGRMGGVTKIS
jgi:hypothetical protein